MSSARSASHALTAFLVHTCLESTAEPLTDVDSTVDFHGSDEFLFAVLATCVVFVVLNPHAISTIFSNSGCVRRVGRQSVPSSHLGDVNTVTSISSFVS